MSIFAVCFRTLLELLERNLHGDFSTGYLKLLNVTSCDIFGQSRLFTV